jgi:hypothetical protein
VRWGIAIDEWSGGGKVCDGSTPSLPPPLVEWSGGISKACHVSVFSRLNNVMFGGVSSMGNAYSIQTWCTRPFGYWRLI